MTIKFKIRKLKTPTQLNNRYGVEIVKEGKIQHIIYLDTYKILTKKELTSKTIEILLQGYLDRFKETFIKLRKGR